MRTPWVYKTAAQADLKVEIDSDHAVVSIQPAMAPGMAGIGVALTLVEINWLQNALGKAAAHLRGLKRAA